MKNNFSALEEAERIVSEYLKKGDTKKKRKHTSLIFISLLIVSAAFFLIFLKF